MLSCYEYSLMLVISIEGIRRHTGGEETVEFCVCNIFCQYCTCLIQGITTNRNSLVVGETMAICILNKRVTRMVILDWRLDCGHRSMGWLVGWHT